MSLKDYNFYNFCCALTLSLQENINYLGFSTTELSLLRDFKSEIFFAISFFVSKMEGKHWLTDFF